MSYPSGTGYGGRPVNASIHNTEPTLDPDQFGWDDYRPARDARFDDDERDRDDGIEYNGEPVVDERVHFGWFNYGMYEKRPEEQEETESIDRSVYEEIAQRHWQMHDDEDFRIGDITAGQRRRAAHPSSTIDRETRLVRTVSEYSNTEYAAAAADFTSDSGSSTEDLTKVQSRRSVISNKDLVNDNHRWYHYLLFRTKHIAPVPKERTVCPEARAGIFSIVTWNWMSPLMTTGYQRTLEYNDLWTVNPKRSTEVLTQKLNANFEKRAAAGGKRPLVGALYDTFKFEFILGGVCQLIASIVQVVNPFILRFLIAFASDAYYSRLRGVPGPNIGHGIGLVFTVTILQFIQSGCTNQFLYRGQMNGGQARATLMCLIFDKAMTISARARAGDKNRREKEDALPEGIVPGSKEETKWREKQKKKAAKEMKKKKKEFEKAKEKGPMAMLALANANATGWANGRIINLMSVDTYRIDQASGMFHMIWTSPISIVITLILLLVNITYSALAGFGFLVLAMPLLAKAIRSLFNRRKAINKITDQRVSLTQEILTAVRFVKYFGWEESFLERIEKLRRKEIRSIQFLLSIRNGINAISMSTPIFASMLAFITYALTSHNLNPAYIFSSLALFNSLRLPLNLLPMVLGQVVDAMSSLNRIQEFLQAENAKDESIWDYDNEKAIDMTNGAFTWEQATAQQGQGGAFGGAFAGAFAGANKGQMGQQAQAEKIAKEARAQTKARNKAEKKARKIAAKLALKQGGGEEKPAAPGAAAEGPKANPAAGAGGGALAGAGAGAFGRKTEQKPPFEITDLTFSAGREELIAVIGGVGSGKSSLLAALAGDMRKTSGSVVMGATRAFCPQYAWIQNATVRDNILFGKEMDEEWYNIVIDACALRADLDMLPNGDMTEIGERGITVSGGQKQRLNIARAIYFNSEIVLMDDPLSAVDAHVGRHIMDQAICGLLRHKCRILATHQLWVLNRCDKIVWMDDGRIKAIDTFEKLMATSPDFVDLIANNAQEKGEDQKKPNEDEVEEEKKEQQKPKGKKPVGGALMQAEERAVSNVSSEVYMAYVRASGTVWSVPIVLFFLILSQGTNIVTSLWLSWWTGQQFDLPIGAYVGVYAGLGALQALLLFIFSVVLSVYGTNASKVMLHRAITRVLRAPMSFFDTTPLGRITNRFSKDIDTMDNVLSDSIRFFSITMGMIISVFVLIIAYYYYFIVALVPMAFLFVFAAGFYRASAREVKRHEAVLRSHVFARFSEAVSGVATIRAYGLESRFSKSIREVVDDMNSAYYLTFANQRWLAVRLDLIGNLLVFVVGVLVVTSRFAVSPSTGGLVLSYILSIVQMIQFSVRQLAEVENNMNSTERIHYYGTQIEEEAPAHLKPVDPAWPQRGEIVFRDVQMRYREGLPLVLNNLNLHVAAGERIGVVGRTGAGKSSIMSTLFRITELANGSITIDGIDISTIGLADLRSRMAIIPQDPTLFKGTVRSNLDPFNSYTDLELWSALRQADLVSSDPLTSKDSSDLESSNPSSSASTEKPNTPDTKETFADVAASSSRFHLDSPVEEEGLNFSLGQRQLMALARALVRGSRIIVCDEATSSVDMETDSKIQRTMAHSFKGRTLLCIAHRLKTIINYDRIVVMDKGEICELGTPIELWNAGGVFRSMCDRSSIQRDDFT